MRRWKTQLFFFKDNVRLLVESTGISELLPGAEPRLGRRTALTLPLFPPPQKNSSPPSDSSPVTTTPGGISTLSRTSPVRGSIRRKSLWSPSQVPCHSSPSNEIAELRHRNASKRERGRVVAQGDPLQRAEGIARRQRARRGSDQRVHLNPVIFVTPTLIVTPALGASHKIDLASRGRRTEE